MEDLIEMLKSIRNRCDIAETLYRMTGKLYLIPTVLEDLYKAAQDMIDAYCVEQDDD